MVNYTDYITLNNQRIDTWYDFNNIWDSIEVTLKVWFVEDKTKDVVLINEHGSPGWTNPCCIQLWCEWINTLYSSYYYYYQPQDNYLLGVSGGLWSPKEMIAWVSQDDNTTYLYSYIDGNLISHMNQPTLQRYKVYSGGERYWRTFWNFLPEGRFYIWSLLRSWEWNTFNFYYFKLKINGDLVVDLKACLDEEWNPAVYDEINQTYIQLWNRYTNSMIKTVVMSWDRQELPIDDWIERNKIWNRIIEVNKYTDWYAAKYDEICISADEDNIEWIEVSDYTIENQVNQGGVADFIELKPRWMLVLPWNKQIAALNRPIVKWHRWDLLRIVVR